MKKQLEICQLLFIITMFMVLYSCNNPAPTSTENTKKGALVNHDFDWLIGKWKRMNEEKNKITFEQWQKKSESELIGFGYTMQNKDTIWQENIKLIKTGNKWSYDVTGKGEINPTKFGVTVIEKRKLVCENSANEFPKKIEYSMLGDTLHATISGNDMEVVFNFEKDPFK